MGGVKYSKDGRKLLEAPGELSGAYSVKEGTKIICDSAFWYCSSLSEIVIPSSVTSIGKGAFYVCDSLSEIVIPSSVTSIGDSAFYGCKFPDNLKQELIFRFGDKIFKQL